MLRVCTVSCECVFCAALCLWVIFNVLCVFHCAYVQAHAPFNVYHCIQSTVRVCVWMPLMLLGSVCRNKRAFQWVFMHMPRACSCISTAWRGWWGRRDREWWVMPEVVFYQPLANGLLSGLADRLAGSQWLLLPYLVVEGGGMVAAG